MSHQPPIDWNRLGGDIAEAQRSSTDGDELRRVRDRLFNAAANDRAATPTIAGVRRWTWVLAFAASLALCWAAWRGTRPDRPLSFETGTEATSGRVGALLLAESSETLPVRFSDGSTLTMTSASRARVADTTPHGATVVLDDGSIKAAVVHREASQWRVVAGPFTVLVTGTKFDVFWNTGTQTFELDLHEGSVTVLGPSLPAGVGRKMSPGERLQIAVESAPPAEVSHDVERAAPVAVDSSPVPSRPERPVATAKRPSWRQLARDAQYPEALSAAEAEDFPTLCRRESSPDLLLLGDTAHFARSVERAEQAFRAVRARFPGSHEAAVAAFSFGRIAHDERHNFGAAVDWFKTYLREEPGGTLAREASGRLIEACRAAGNLAAAREAAKTYLATYPSGPHAALAQSLSSR